jgi:hypothetical protein
MTHSNREKRTNNSTLQVPLLPSPFPTANARSQRNIIATTSAMSKEAQQHEKYLQDLHTLERQNEERLDRARERSGWPKIPRHEQDEDAWRFERPIPGRDPVTEERGMGS